MRPRRTLVRAGVLLLAAAAAAGACGSGRREVQDLLATGDPVELRGGSLNLSFLLDQPLDHAGWLPRQPGGPPLWSRWPEAWLELPLAAVSPRQLSLGVRAHRRFPETLRVEVALNDTPLRVLPVTDVEAVHSLALPEGAQHRGLNRLLFRVVDWKRFRDAGARTDNHRFAGALGRWLAVSQLTIAADGQEDGDLPCRDGSRLWLPRGWSASWYVNGPAGRLRLRAQPAAAGGSGRLQVEEQQGHEVRVLASAEPSLLGRIRTSATVPAGTCRLEVQNAGSQALWIDSVLLARRAPVPAAPQPVRPVTHPNVLIYLADALRADYLGVYGHRDATSPQVDAFARDAIVFESVMAQSSWTLPTVASLFTGLGAPAHGVVETGSVLSQAIDTLAERFRATGYRTAAFLGNDVVGARFGFNQGFDVWRPCGRMRPLPLVQEALQNGVFSGPSPFFVYIHSLEPHAPFEPGPEFWAPFAFDYRGTRDTRTLRSRSVTAEEGRYERTAYEGEIRETDAAFGVLLRALSDQGVLDRSVVVFTADHGEGLRERGGRGGHGHNLYREVCRIPLVIRLPGGRGAGKRWSEPVQQVDLLPSLLGLAGLAAEGPGEGRDLSRQWEAGVPAREDRLLFSSLSRSGFKKSAVQLGKTKLIVNKDALWEQARRLELYDVEGDPGERHNLAAERPVLTRYLQRLMWQEEGRQRELGQRLQSGERLALSPDELRQLRALGYVE